MIFSSKTIRRLITDVHNLKLEVEALKTKAEKKGRKTRGRGRIKQQRVVGGSKKSWNGRYAATKLIGTSAFRNITQVRDFVGKRTGKVAAMTNVRFHSLDFDRKIARVDHVYYPTSIPNAKADLEAAFGGEWAVTEI